MTTNGVALSDAQRRAVEWEDGPLLVLAGPGAGKTEVLTERACRLIRRAPKRRFRVLGLTFTNFAAGEMKQRLDLRLSTGADRVRAHTFHSFCAGVLRQHGSHLGLKPDFRILTLPAERALVLARMLGPRAPWGSQPPPAERIARNLDSLFRQDPCGPGPALHENNGASFWTPDLLEPYVHGLIRENCLDYGALLYCCLRLVRRHEWFQEDFPILYPHVLVDEYQDTNAIQDRLLRELWPPGSADLFVVADDDQTIFQWNGASPERITDLKSDYDMSVLHLPETYRCAPEIVTRANRLLDSVSDGRIPKEKMVASGRAEAGDAIRVHVSHTEREEAAWVARDLRSRGIAPNECAVLARSGRLLEVAADALQQAGLRPWRRQLRDEFLSPEIRFLLASLRLANSPRDGAQLRLLLRALTNMTGARFSAADFERCAEVENGALLTALTRADGLPPKPAAPLLALIRQHLVDHHDYRRFVSKTLDALETRLADCPDPESVEEEISVWRSLDAQIRRQGGGRLSLARFLHDLDLRPVVAEPTQDQVQCLTIHQAKGKGFPHIYVMGLAEGQFPSYFAKTDREIEEERRVCFVAITRSSRTLTLSRARFYFGWRKAASRFLSEMGL